MIYKTLTANETNIWISNLENVVKLNTELSDLWNSIEKQYKDDYKKYYRTGWTKIFYDEYFHFGGDGKPFELSFWFIPLCKLKKLSFWQNELRWFIIMNDEKFEELNDVKTRWVKYADKPFQINEDDVIFYQKLIKFYSESTDIADGVGITYEAFNLDENS